MKHMIGFVGRKGAGKDTAAGLLAQLAWDRYRLDLRRVAFADPLKDLCADIFHAAYGVPGEFFHGTQAEKETPLNEYGLSVTGRQILQHMGTEGLRALAPDIHVRLAFARNVSLICDGYLYTDVRFPDEAAAIRSKGGVLVRLTRAADGCDTHASEAGVENIRCDYVLDNATWAKGRLQRGVEDLARVLLG